MTSRSTHFTLVKRPTDDTATFEVECGKGTYVRALARDMGALLGCEGHVTALRRTWVEPFEEADAVTLEALEACDGDHAALDALLRTPMQAMDGFEELRVDSSQAARLRLGNSIIVRGRDAPIETEDVCAVHKSTLVAIGDVRRGEFHPRRVLAAQ